MSKAKIVIPFLLIAAAILFVRNDDVYGGGGGVNIWGIDYSRPKGTEWTGTLVITGQIVDVTGLAANVTTGLPEGLPEDAASMPAYNDQIVKIKFFVRLENAKRGYAAFSGVAKDKIEDKEYYLYYALGDYGGRLTNALHNFLEEKVYPKLFPNANGTANGALTDLTESSNNVESQLAVDGGGLQAGTPLYYNAKIKVVTY